MYHWFQNLTNKRNGIVFRGILSRKYNSSKRFLYEFSFGIKGPSLELDMYSGDNNDSIKLALGFIFITMYFTLEGILKCPKDSKERRNGFYYYERSLHIFLWKISDCWSSDGSTHIIDKCFWMPWDWEHMDDKHMVMLPDKSWAKYDKNYYGFEFDIKEEPTDSRWHDVYTYRYIRKNGDIQDRMARIYVERREWRWRWFKWLPFPSKKGQYIDIEFNGELGEESGSWKGGTLGCSYQMQKNETPLETLRRMERKRKF